MSATDIAVLALSGGAIFSGWRVFRTPSMVRASFALLLSFVAVAGIVLLLGAPYIGIATIFMMAVEMTVMALFMVMFMMNPAGLNPMHMVHQERFAIVAGIVAFAGISAAALFTPLPAGGLPPPVDGGLRGLGLQLLGGSMLPFEAAGVTLLTAMLAAVTLSCRSGRFGDADQGSVPPTLVAGGRPAGETAEEP